MADDFSKRDSAFSMNLSLEADKVHEMLSIADRLFALAGSRVIEVITADAIDKERKNPDVPHINRVLFEFGIHNEPIRRTLIQYKALAGNIHPPRTSKLLQSLTCDLAQLLVQVETLYDAAKAELGELKSAMEGWVSRSRGIAISEPIPQTKSL